MNKHIPIVKELINATKSSGSLTDVFELSKV